MASVPSPSPPLHHTTSRTTHRTQSSQPWHAHLTLDLLLRVLSNTLFHPFISALLPLCLRALAAPYTSPSFITTSAFAICVSLYWILEPMNRRIAYGGPRKINWEDEVVVITGGLGGLGGCLAEIFALRGVEVAVLDIAVARTKETKKDGQDVSDGEEKEGVRYYCCDVGDHEEVKTVWARVTEDLGMPTVLINNAAIVNGKLFMKLEREELERLLYVNTMSHFQLAKMFLADLLSTGTGGTLVTVSSVLAHQGAANLSVYAASKAAVTACHKCLSAELAGFAPQIKTILVAPGQLDTQLFGNVKLRGFLRNFLAPVVGAGEVAVKIVEMVDRGDGGVVSLPAYARWIAWMGVLPVGVQRVLREWAGVDSQFAIPSQEEDKIGPSSPGEKRLKDEG
ncbi:hypothetical protein ABVK25_004538 [Lepraria finkii]|uniref:Ketoreductase domain-containing protein n=1 Tax=Lepraria finkii TaxID=1340010 RepID=A0ABR4BC16_9LECA